ncbi:MAG TPA: hypothetical protein VJ739_05410, partial [Gemmataceae bacterium]|nr:hypothetical protein [Gemmataceae bacterium]
MPSIRGWLRQALRQGPPARARRPFRPAVEALEARDVPAVFFLGQQEMGAEQGIAFTGEVAAFHASTLNGADPAAALANLHATIIWGDGHSSDGVISGPDASGTLHVSGTNTYQFVQRFAVGVTVHDDNDHTWNSTTTFLLVKPNPADAPRLSAAVQTVTANAGQNFNGVLAVITDPNLQATAGKLQVKVDYGDGSAPQDATVVAESTPGLFDVRGNHTYALAGSFTVNVSVHDSNNDTWAAASGGATVGPNPAVFATTGVNVAASAGQPFAGVVAVIQDTGSNARAANLQVSIDWGDGTGLTTGTVRASANPGFFEVVGSHTYLLSGSDSVQVWVREAGDGRTTSATATATVAAAPPNGLTASAVAVNAAPGAVYSGVVGIIHATNSNVAATNLTAVVDWGNGSGVTAAPIRATSAPGFFEVLGSHTFSQAGSGQLRVWVQDNLDGLAAQD